MNYSEIFHFMRPELTLIVTIALHFLFDLFAPERLRRYFHPLACVLLKEQILVNIVPTPDSGLLFGGMYQYEPMQSIVKSMLAIGTFVVFLQSNEWLRREDTAHKRGEFYLLTLSTLLGMYFMISAGNFLMFFLGMAYCYFIVFRMVFQFIAGFSPNSVNFAPDIDSYFSFVLALFLAFGLTFEVPIIVVVLNRMGITSISKLKKARPYMVVGAFVLAAIVTPPDVLSQCLLALPLVILYQVGIWLCAVFGKKDEPEEESAESS